MRLSVSSSCLVASASVRQLRLRHDACAFWRLELLPRQRRRRRPHRSRRRGTCAPSRRTSRPARATRSIILTALSKTVLAHVESAQAEPRDLAGPTCRECASASGPARRLRAIAKRRQGLRRSRKGMCGVSSRTTLPIRIALQLADESLLRKSAFDVRTSIQPTAVHEQPPPLLQPGRARLQGPGRAEARPPAGSRRRRERRKASV